MNTADYPARILALLISAWSSMSMTAAPRTVLDRSTGATIELAATPWVLALDHPNLAAHARDYIALYALETNIGGKRRHHLAAFFWSTVPGRQQFAGKSPAIRVQLDDRDLVLASLGQSPRDFGIGNWPLKPPERSATLAIYEVDPALLRQLGVAQRFRVRPETDASLPPDLWFSEWRSARGAFRAFSQQVLRP